MAGPLHYTHGFNATIKDKNDMWQLLDTMMQ